VAERLLANWSRTIDDFVKVMPRDYKRALLARTASHPKVASIAKYAEVANG